MKGVKQLSASANDQDDSFVVKLRSGSDIAFEELLERFETKVWFLALRITRNKEDAEEVLQDVFTTVFRKIFTFRGQASLSSWIFRIAYNHALIKIRRRQKHHAVGIDELGDAIPLRGLRSDTVDTDYMSIRHELRAALDSALAKLPKDYRLIFVLRDVDGLSNEETAEVMGMSLSATKSKLHRSRLLLRSALAKHWHPESKEAA